MKRIIRFRVKKNPRKRRKPDAITGRYRAGLGFRVNPSARAGWIIVAEMRRGDPGTEYGVDMVTPQNWIVTNRRFHKDEYGYSIPNDVTNTGAFRDFMNGARKKTIYGSYSQIRETFREMLPEGHRHKVKKNPSPHSFLANNCDGSGPHAGPNQVRLFPLGGGGNAILCRACWNRENVYNEARGALGKTRDWNTAEIYASEAKKNPRKRRAVRRRMKMISRRDFRGDYRAVARGTVTFGHPDKRRLRRLARSQGFRVNPTARRPAYIVSAKAIGASPKTAAGVWMQCAAFFGRERAFEYARAFARKYPRSAVKVEKR